MYDIIPTPQDFYQAKRQSVLMERAAAMSAKGYKAVPFATSDQAYYVDGGKEGYVVYLLAKPQCSCPDFARHGDVCKHIFFTLAQTSATAKVESSDEVESRRNWALKNRDRDF